jgi:Fe-S cluster biogenesis protein NfuA
VAWRTHAGKPDGKEQVVEQQVREVIDQIRPSLQADGGDISLVEVTDEGVVKVRLQGACRGCPGAAITLKMGVERILKARLPQVTAVENVD